MTMQIVRVQSLLSCIHVKMRATTALAQPVYQCMVSHVYQCMVSHVYQCMVNVTAPRDAYVESILDCMQFNFFCET